MLSFGAKVMAMCTNNVKTRDEVKPGFWANFLWRFAGINHTGVGMHEPYKLQLVIDMCGLPRVLLAAFLSAVTKPFGVHGVFYKVCGKGVGGIDGFYFRSSFDVYKQMALINPPNPVELCNALEKETGIPVVLMDANDIEQNQLGKCDDFPLTDDEIQDAMKDNPSGQGDELTPLILIRPVKVREDGDSGGEAASLREAPLPQTPSPEERWGIGLTLPSDLRAPASWARVLASGLWSRRLTEPPRPANVGGRVVIIEAVPS